MISLGYSMVNKEYAANEEPILEHYLYIIASDTKEQLYVGRGVLLINSYYCSLVN